jgi:hypothetical protein
MPLALVPGAQGRRGEQARSDSAHNTAKPSAEPPLHSTYTPPTLFRSNPGTFRPFHARPEPSLA